MMISSGTAGTTRGPAAPSPPPRSAEGNVGAGPTPLSLGGKGAGGLGARIRETAAVLLAYAVLTVGLTWPLAAVGGQVLPDGADDWQFVWNLWWMRTALLDLHTNPFHTGFLYYPGGVDLYLNTLAPAIGLAGIPLQALGLSLVAVYNLLALSSFVIAGYGTYLLVRRLTGARPAAFVAGLIFAFCPYHFAHLLGHLNLVWLQWIPLYVLALVHTWDGPAPDRRAPLAWAALAGIWLAVAAYTDWYYVLFLGLFTAWFVGWQTGIARQGPGWRAGAARLAMLAGVWLALVAPVLGPMLQEARAGGFAQVSIQEVNSLSADLTDAFVPSLFHPLWRVAGPVLEPHYAGRPRPERALFAGYSVMLLSGATVWLFRRSRDVQFWGATALGAWVLSLGPILHVWGLFNFGGARIPLPYLAFYYLPFFNLIRVPGRFMVLVMLALAVLVGQALATAGRQRAGWLRGLRLGPRSAAAAVGALVLFEYLAVPFPTQAWQYDLPFYHTLAVEPGQFAVLELPLRPLPIYEGYQTIHGRPIVGGYLSRQPPDPFVDRTPVLRYLLPTTPIDDPLAALAARTGLTDLRAAHIRYAIVHWSTLYGPNPDALRAKLARVFPGVSARQFPGDEMTVLQLEP